MNYTLLDNFKSEVRHIGEYLTHIQQADVLINSTASLDQNHSLENSLHELRQHGLHFKVGKKTFEYKATIITLYGLLEKYIDLWVKDYLEILSSMLGSFHLLREAVRNNHFDLSLKLISIITTRESAKYQHISKEEIIKNLNSCVSTPNNYTINLEAFTILSGNLKHAKIVEIFKLLGINLNDGLIKSQELNNEIGLSEGRIKNTEKDIIYNKINQIVDWRNDIAHGSQSISSNILDSSELEPYIKFLEKYCIAVFQILYEDILSYTASNLCFKLGSNRKIVSKNILAFEINNYEIKEGDFILIRNVDGDYCKKEISSIGINKILCPHVFITNNMWVAIGLEHNLKNNQEFFLYKQ